MSIRQGNNIIAGNMRLDSSHYIGEWIQVSISDTVTPEGCVKADGFEQLDAPNSMFADLWKYCLTPSDDWNGKSYLDTCTYTEYEQSVAEFGACTKFAVDIAGKKFKVPFVPDGYVMEQGQGVVHKPGLPNITGSFRIDGDGNTGPIGYLHWDGAFEAIGSSPTRTGGGTVLTRNSLMTIDASRSNPIYGASDTVQPKSIGVRWYIYIANAEIGDFAINWNKIQGALEGKANVDLDNLSKAGQDKIKILCPPTPTKTPDYRAGITISKSPFTAPSDGIIRVIMNAFGTSDVVNGATIVTQGNTGAAYHSATVIIPVAEGDVDVYSGGGGRVFYPLKGAN